MSDITQLPVLTGNENRKRFTETQTKKYRRERWQNVADSFLVTDEEVLSNKNILLADHAITAGTTLETCGQSVVPVAGVKLSVATSSTATS